MEYTDTELIDALERGEKRSIGPVVVFDGAHWAVLDDREFKSSRNKPTIRQVIVYWIEQGRK
jgi:hypothetical protein